MSEYRKRLGGEILSDMQLRNAFPDQALPAVLDVITLHNLGFDPILPSPAPIVDETKTVVRNGAQIDTLGNWVYRWKIVDLPADVVASKRAEALAMFKRHMTEQVQKRLDDFAATRGYGDARTSPTVSIATYIGSIVPKFATEAAYFKDQRDLTWAKLYEIEADVLAGKRPAPKTFTEIEAELPELRWPEETN